MKKLIKKIKKVDFKKLPNWQSNINVTKQKFIERHSNEITKGILQKRAMQTINNKYKKIAKENIKRSDKEDLSKIWNLLASRLSLGEVYANYIVLIEYLLGLYLDLQGIGDSDNLWEAKLGDEYTD